MPMAIVAIDQKKKVLSFLKILKLHQGEFINKSTLNYT